MQTKFLLALLFCFPISIFSFAQQKQKVNLESVTVYLSSAELFSNTKITLPQGESEMIFTNVAGNIQKPTLQIAASNNVVVESAEIKNDYLQDDNFSPAAKIIKDSIDAVNKDLQTIKIKTDVLDEEINVLRENRKVSGVNTNVSVAELQKMMSFISDKMNDLLTQKSSLASQTNKLNEKIVKLQTQLNEEQQKLFTPGGQLAVKFYSPQATTSNIDIQYVVANAGWNPSYDVRADKKNNIADIVFKASVFQNCGIKWDNVKLSLSTGNPAQGAQEPTLDPLYLSFFQPIQNMLEGRVSGVVVTTGLGIQRADKDFGYATDEKPATLNNYVTTNNSGVNTTYDIDLNYSIPSDGQTHLVPVKDLTIPALYRYVTIPKLDEDVFLEARITDWQNLNLLPAMTNVYYDGAFVGNGYLDTKNTTDTLNISFGRDKKIVVQREKNIDFSSAKFLGSNVRKQTGYNISIRNMRSEAIEIFVKDQFPLSTNKDIEISDKTAEGAAINNDTGDAEWTLNIQPNETKKIFIGYTVKYPKDKVVAGL